MINIFNTNFSSEKTNKNSKYSIVGTMDNDWVVGKDSNDVLNGRGGNDTLFGGIGDDVLAGDKGRDFLKGDVGNDTLRGGVDNDTLFGGTGNDVLAGDKGRDFLKGDVGNDTLRGGADNDTLFGGTGNDVLAGDKGKDFLKGDRGNDMLKGDRGNDTLQGDRGNDTLMGGAGNDLILSRSDAGEPEIAQETDSPKVYPDRTFTASNDVLAGGTGANTFLFEILLNAKPEIMAKHANAQGKIDWKGVTGENNNVHDHWVEGIGNDTILDFNREVGDKINIMGHTVDPNIEYGVDEKGKEYSIINLVSNQGGAGAHDGDELGTITVYGDRVTESDLGVDRMALSAVYENINQL